MRWLQFLIWVVVAAYMLALIVLKSPMTTPVLTIAYFIVVLTLQARMKKSSPGILGLIHSGDPGKHTDLWLTPLAFREIMEFELARVVGKRRNRFLQFLSMLALMAFFVFFFEIQRTPSGGGGGSRFLIILIAMFGLPFALMLLARNAWVARKTAATMLNAVSTKAQMAHANASPTMLIALAIGSVCLGAVMVGIIEGKIILIPLGLAGAGVTSHLLRGNFNLENTVSILNQRADLGEQHYLGWAARTFDEAPEKPLAKASEYPKSIKKHSTLK